MVQCICFMLFCAALCVLPMADSAAAEIYKWVDENGNVHFGDRPLDPEKADKAEEVEIDEAYQPPARSEEEIDLLRKEQEENWQRATDLRREEQEQDQQERAEREQEKAKLCAKYASEIRALSEMRRVNGRRRHYVIVDEQGNPVSEEAQGEQVESLKSRAAEAGCPQTYDK